MYTFMTAIWDCWSNKIRQDILSWNLESIVGNQCRAATVLQVYGCCLWAKKPSKAEITTCDKRNIFICRQFWTWTL